MSWVKGADGEAAWGAQAAFSQGSWRSWNPRCLGPSLPLPFPPWLLDLALSWLYTESIICGAVPSCPNSCLFCPQGSVLSERDYESLVMMRMRQAAERQQLIAQMQQEDEGRPT